MSDPKFVNGKKLTAEGVAELRKRMPHAELAGFEENPHVDRIADLFTVDAIVRYVERKVGAEE